MVTSMRLPYRAIEGTSVVAHAMFGDPFANKLVNWLEARVRKVVEAAGESEDYVSRGVKLQPKGAWINDLMRTECGEPYQPEEPQLPRAGLNVQG